MFGPILPRLIRNCLESEGTYLKLLICVPGIHLQLPVYLSVVGGRCFSRHGYLVKYFDVGV